MVQFVVFLFFSLDIFVFFFDVNMRSWIIILDNPGLETETGKCIFLQNGLISCQKSKFPEPKQNTGISLLSQKCHGVLLFESSIYIFLSSAECVFFAT